MISGIELLDKGRDTVWKFDLDNYGDWKEY